MSQAALDSRRINIKKALAVPKEVLFRSTPKRKESCRTKLIGAREAKRRKREEGKSTGISHGLTCADLRGSLAAAGATPEELKAHRQKFRDELGPKTPVETKLVRGMADCAWRRDEVGHTQAVEDIITTESRLMVAAEPEQAGLMDFAVAKLAINFFNQGLDLEERLKKLNGRFGHLAYLFLAGRGMAEGFLPKLRWNGSNADMIEWSAEAMGNPFVTRRKVAKVMAPKTGEMKPASEFEWKGAAAREAERLERIRQQALDLDERALKNLSDNHPAMSVRELLGRDQNVVLVVDGGKTQVALGETVEGQPVRTQYVAGGTAAFTAGIGASRVAGVAGGGSGGGAAEEVPGDERGAAGKEQRGRDYQGRFGEVVHGSLWKRRGSGFGVGGGNGIRGSGFGVRRRRRTPIPFSANPQP